MDSSFAIPERLGVIALPGAVLFPGALLPLYIFEPRYRKMLADSLGSDRMFAVGQTCEADDDTSVYEIGAVGVVRACVGNADGTSHLLLQGLERVRFVDWLEGEPYPYARVKVIASKNPSPMASARLVREVHSLSSRLGEEGARVIEKFEAVLEERNNFSEFADLVASAVVSDLPVRRRLLEETNVANRLEILAGYLAHLA